MDDSDDVFELSLCASNGAAHGVVSRMTLRSVLQAHHATIARAISANYEADIGRPRSEQESIDRRAADAAHRVIAAVEKIVAGASALDRAPVARRRRLVAALTAWIGMRDREDAAVPDAGKRERTQLLRELVELIAPEGTSAA